MTRIPRSHRARAIGLGALLLAIALSASVSRPCAAVPTLMNYQGYLTDNSNSAVTGAYPMTFKLYADSTADSLLWSESYATVAVTAGVFNVVLGTATPLPPSVFTGDILWLLTTVNGVSILPRRPIVTVAYAFRSSIADSATRVSAVPRDVGEVIGQVSIGCAANSGGVLVYIPGRSFIAYTAASGSFDLSSVPPGTYTVHIEGSTPASSTDVNNVVVTAGRTTNIGIVTLGANLATDPNNCGACGLVCSANHVPMPSCDGGVCNGACAAGWADCDGNMQTDGCETDLSSNLIHCGGCGLVCSVNHISTPSCDGGVCNGACNAGYADCDGSKQTDGCEDGGVFQCEQLWWLRPPMLVSSRRHAVL